MRNPSSLFSIACSFINKVPVGKTFTSKKYISVVGKHEALTRWKISNSNPHYTSHQYKTELKKAEFISKVSHGVWKVNRHIPNWFSSAHTQVLNGYKASFNGMNRTDIIAQCDEDAHYAMGLIIRPIPTQDEPGHKLPALRKANYETYQSFIWNAKEHGIKEFRTQNELAAYIEDLKWPGVGNDGKKPRYAIQGNYSPIINHLMADGILTRKMVNNKWIYTVHVTKSTQPREQIRASVIASDVNVKVKTIDCAPTATAIRIAENSTYGAYAKQESPNILEKLQAIETLLEFLQSKVKSLIVEIKNENDKEE